MKIVKHYRTDDCLRASFNALAEATFGLNFENWYQMGYWADAYDPYSAVEDGQVVANVSVNRTDLCVNGERRRLYQLGTVMTAPAFRNRGYIRGIMAEIEKDIRDGDGVYLFANDEVLSFYPKFGFAPGEEWVYCASVETGSRRRVQQVLMDSPENRARLEKAMAESRFPVACGMVDNPGLVFFYAAQFLRECVFYDEMLDVWTIAEQEEDHLLLHNVFGPETVSLREVIEGFGSTVRQVTLGFTPADPAGFTCRKLKEEDCTFFVKGEGLADFGKNKLRIPTLAHA